MAFTPEQISIYEDCTGSLLYEEQFTEIKTYWRYSLPFGIFTYDGEMELFCGHNVEGRGRHGYSHINPRHATDWQNLYSSVLTSGVDVVNVPPNWQDLMDMLIVQAVAFAQPTVETATDRCWDQPVAVWNVRTNEEVFLAYYSVRMWKPNSAFGYFTDTVTTAYPVTDRMCDGSPPPPVGAKRSSFPNNNVLRCDGGGCTLTGGSGITAYTEAFGAHWVGGPFDESWVTHRGALGYPTDSIKCGYVRDGCFSHFENDGSIYYSPATGAHTIANAIRTKWQSLGWERSTLGYPTTDDKCGLLGDGCFNHFENDGSIYYSPATGAHTIANAIRTKWQSLGWERSTLGYPTTDDKCGLLGDGCFNHFENDGSIYYSPATGAHTMTGAIRTAWGDAGWERSPFGYPVTDEEHPGGGAPSSHRVQIFENGFLYWDGQYVTGEWGDPGCTTCQLRVKVSR